MTPDEFEKFKVAVASMELENSTLKERIAALEKRMRPNRWLLGLVLLILVCTFAFLRWPTIQTFSGRWMATNDRDGHIGAWLDDTGLRFMDKQGRVRAKFGLFPGGSPFLQMFSEDGVMRAQLFIYPPDKAGYLMLWGKDGKGVRYPASLLPEK